MKVIENIKDFRELTKNKKLIIVDFFAVWCGPCVMLTPSLTNLQEKYGNDNIEIVKVDVDNENLAELCEECEITCMPTIVFYFNNELQINRIEGANVNAIESSIKEFIEKLI